MKTLIGMVTFGNLAFTKLAIEEIRRTVEASYRLFVVVGKPDDEETKQWLGAQGEIGALRHSHNLGFPASINDIYDHAFVTGDFDNVVIVGNDVIVYPGAIDALVEAAATTGYEWICSSQFDSKSLVVRYPETARYFGPKMEFLDFGARPWEAHEEARRSEIRDRRPEELIQPDCIKDVRNLCLFKRSVFEKIGYADVNFWPGGYFEDNDYCRRGLLAGVKACGLAQSAYFHFWSRTIHQGPHASDARRHLHFQRNQVFYLHKWGGPFGEEEFGLPFNSEQGINLKLADRSGEASVIKYWSELC